MQKKAWLNFITDGAFWIVLFQFIYLFVCLFNATSMLTDMQLHWLAMDVETVSVSDIKMMDLLSSWTSAKDTQVFLCLNHIWVWPQDFSSIKKWFLFDLQAVTTPHPDKEELCVRYVLRHETAIQRNSEYESHGTVAALKSPCSRKGEMVGFLTFFKPRSKAKHVGFSQKASFS